ncbi:MULTISPECIES: ScbA/BarX family gamma-butyrolactone biosynthesis protein [unclassified Streptomyces]|uniref:ScbA/BarX family gamma-butyrolactone biosynthesis protein n=1 Tax=Streptomyces sp. 900105245 TaxID=3154379 RepID=A0ABV1UF39_9ACTN|nr:MULTISPECIES: ScbA/BarX family gamma-butyrolactone biosynthesis protein [unclassified Streptomyces]ROP44525.1 A-factor biosynthesis hotdog protein [Streptomyces sp. PanSC9]
MLITTERPIAVRQPVLTTTVAREYVHRAALSEVFLTGWSKGGPDSFTVTAQWPRSHSFYSSEHGLYDPLLLSETVRQTGLLLMHVGYHMPFGHQISWSRLQYAINPQALRIEPTPAEIELHVTCSDIKYQGKMPRTMVMHLEAVRAGSLLAMASIRFNTHSPAVYQRLRAGRNTQEIFASVPEPIEPVSRAAVGRLRLQDIVLSPTEDSARWQLRVDTSHPVLFDHPVDHVPGMLLLEAVRQAGHAMDPAQAGAALPVSLDVSFNRYVEFDEPCWIEAEQIPTTSSSSGARRTLRVNARQKGSFAFNATAELADAASL